MNILIIENSLSDLIRSRINIKYCSRNNFKFFFCSLKKDINTDNINISEYLLFTGFNIYNFIKIIYRLNKYMRDNDIDLVHGYRLESNIIVLFLSIFNPNRKFIFHVTGLGKTFSSKKAIYILLRGFYKVFYKICYIFSTRLIMQNIDDIKKMGFQFKEKCILLEGSGVELQNSMNLELRYDIEKSQDDVIRLVCTSRFLVDKGIYELINAISVVRMLGLNVKLVLALKVYHLDDINSIISKFEKFSWLDLYFNLHDVTSILKSSDVYIYPSYYREGIPRGILEAMAASLPILTTSMPGCKETVVNGVNGFLFTPKSVLSIVDKIFRILTTGCDLKKMGNESFLIFENRFSSKKINKQLLNIYNDSERFKFDSKVSGMF